MPYNKQTWVDHVEDAVTGDVIIEGTPIDKLHLDHIENGISEAHAKADDVMAQIGNLTIDCGTFDDVDLVATHASDARAHPNILAYGGTLEEHLSDPLAHDNIILDGNIN